jgi:glycosyltransferase involved in cell wall biosynthesis
MNVLLLSPQPYYSERGTPIAVDHVIRALSERGDRIDVLTYHLGEDVDYENVRIHRIPSIAFVSHVPAGPSIRKLLCSLVLFVKALRVVRGGQFDVVHAVEEAAVVAALIRYRYGIPFVYDMDSSMPLQMVAAYPFLRLLVGPLRRLEQRLVRSAKIVLSASEPVSQVARRYRRDGVVTLPDISLIDGRGAAAIPEPALCELCAAHGPLILYVGNLAKNRGITLLLESFAITRSRAPEAHLVIIGGTPTQIKGHRTQAQRLGLVASVSFLGPRPVHDLGGYLAQADILVSPQIETVNTPMKIYSYLASGKPILATDLPAHSAVIDGSSAVLTEPTPKAFAAGLLTLLSDPVLCRRLGERGLRIARDGHDYAHFRRKLWDVYCELDHASTGRA